MNKYLKLEYWNTCDLGNIYYQGGQKFWFYLDADVAEPFHEDVEDGQENGDGEFIPTYRRQMKRYIIRTGLLSDYLIDAIQRMKLHDNIYLTFKTGEIEQIYNVDCEAEWQFEKYAWQGTVTLTFDMDESITVGACCDNLVVQTGGSEPEPDDLYWVAETGNDISGDGTYANPWATLAYACTQAVTPGDVIHVKAGTYNETAQSELAVGVSIIGAGVTSIITSSAALNPIIAANSAAGNAANGNQTISHLAFDGNSLTAYSAIYANFRSNVIISYCTFEDFKYNGVWFDGTVSNWNVTPANIIPTGNEIYNCDFVNCTQFTDNSAGGHIRIEGQNGIEIYNCTFDQTTRGDGENADIIAGYQNYAFQIHDCEFTKNVLNGAAYNFNIEIHYSHGGVDIYDNVFTGGGCLDFSGSVKGTYSYGAKIYGNTFTNPTSMEAAAHDEPYIDLESFDYENDIYVYNNYFNNSRTAIKLNNTQTSSDNIWIYYNIFENVGNTTNAYSNAILVQSNWNDAAGIPISNLHILNNVMDAGQPSYTGILLSCWGDISNIEIRNNIIYGGFGRPIRFTDNGGSPEINTADINNNDFYGNTNTAISYDVGVVYNDLDDSDNITTNPTFVSATDFHLQAGSDCINAGIDVGLTTDYEGNAVSSPPEIGAYEY